MHNNFQHYSWILLLWHSQSLVTTLCLSAPCLADIIIIIIIIIIISHLSLPCVSLLPVWLISDITYQYPTHPAQPTLSHLTALILQHNDTDTDQAYSVTHSHHQASSVTLCSESPLFSSCYCHSTLHITALFKIFWISSSNILLHCIHCVMCFIIKVVYDLQTIKFYNIIENWANIKKKVQSNNIKIISDIRNIFKFTIR